MIDACYRWSAMVEENPLIALAVWMMLFLILAVINAFKVKAT